MKPTDDWYEELEDEVEYCVYCYEPVIEWKQSCCGENHFLSGFQIKEHEREDYAKTKPQGIVYDPPMSETDEYLLRKEREEEHKSYDY